MPAKKTAKKATKKGARKSTTKNLVVTLSYTQLLIQALFIAVVDGIAIYAILKTAVLRNDVDQQLAQELQTPITRINPE